MKKFFNNLNGAGKVFFLVIICTLLFGGYYGYSKLFPKKVKKVNVTTQATGLPPLAYDKNSNAAFRKLPEFNETVDIQSPEVRGYFFGWNALTGALYSIGGVTTSRGSLAEELQLNVKLTVQNSCTEQLNQLYAFAQALHGGEAQPTKGMHMINLMGDGVPNYLTGLNQRIEKDFGKEYICKVVTFAGASYGEDKWLLKAKYAKDARGSLTCTVVRDGDWNICIIKSQLMGWPVNHDLGTYDKSKVNFFAAPNDDYVEAGKVYMSGQKVTLKMVENGKYTGKDTTLSVHGVGSWFPVDQQLVQGRGGLITVASTKEYGSQMACAIIVNSKWATDNRPLVEKVIEAFGRGGDQVKSHDQALQLGSQVNEVVFNDKEKTADDWYKAYKSFDLTDEDGNTVNIGGSRSFSLADAAAYTGVSGGSDKYKVIYNTFGNICKEAYPEVLSTVWPYEEAVDWSYLKAVYTRAKKAGLEGAVSKTDFTASTKGSMIGDASYNIEFAMGSATISPASFAVLDKIVGQLSVVSNAFLEIGGHTDNVGDPASNQGLSEQRAAAVKLYLVSKAEELSEAHRTSVKGYGETQPRFPDNPADGRNRRVTIKLFKANQ